MAHITQTSPKSRRPKIGQDSSPILKWIPSCHDFGLGCLTIVQLRTGVKQPALLIVIYTAATPDSVNITISILENSQPENVIHTFGGSFRLKTKNF